MGREIRRIGMYLILCTLIVSPWAAISAVAQSKQEGAMKGYLYETSRDEIVAKAKKEGALRVSLSLDPGSLNGIQKGFKAKYPFLDCYFEEITGTDARERFLLELQSGMMPNWDITHLSPEIYNKLQPYIANIDLLTMARQKVLNIPPAMVNPNDRKAIASGNIADITVYNSKLLKTEAVPKTYEDFLKPEFKGRKFVLDIKPNYLTGLIPAKGIEWVLDYARKLAAQDPIWSRGQTRALTSMAAGEYSLQMGSYYHAYMRAKMKGAPHLEAAFLEPSSIRLAELLGVLKGARNTYAALLLIEYMASPEGQKIIDDNDPGKASVFSPGSKLEQVIAGRKLSVLGWDHLDNRDDYTDAIFKAYGFPTVKGK